MDDARRRTPTHSNRSPELPHNNKFILPHIKTTSYMESFLPSTTKLWNDVIKRSPTLSSFKKHLNDFFSKTPNELYHFGARRCNKIHCQLRRNYSSDLYKDLFDHYLSDSPACRNCNCKTEDSYHYIFICPAYTTIREVLFENIFNLHIN